MRKEWQKPQLIVITRRQTEENVLTTCKIVPLAGPIGYGCAIGAPCEGIVQS